MILLPYTLLFFVLLSTSMAAPTRSRVFPGPNSVGQVFYTNSANWGHSSPNAYLPVIVITPPTKESVVVVEIAKGMEYLKLGKKILAKHFFPTGTRLSMLGNRQPGVLLSDGDNIYINVDEPRTVQINSVWLPKDRLPAAVLPNFFVQFGHQLRIPTYGATQLQPLYAQVGQAAADNPHMLLPDHGRTRSGGHNNITFDKDKDCPLLHADTYRSMSDPNIRIVQFHTNNTNPNPLNVPPFMSVARVLDVLKPHRAEALQRVRTNTFFLVLLVVLSYLLPLPTVPSAFSHALLLGPRASESIGFERRVISPVPPLRWSFDAAYTWLCTIEAFAVTIFLFNITQGVYALKYPHSSSPTISPARSKTLKSKTAPSSTSPNRHPFRPLSSPKNAAKNTTPQRPFTFSPTQSHSTSGPPGSLSSSSIGPLGLGKGGGVYPTTPADSPSRGSIQYTLPPLGLSNLGDTPSSKLNRSLLSSGASMSSSASTQFPASPTPVVAAWRGRYMVGEIGRPLDGSFLGQISVGPQDESDERERDE